MRRPLTALAFLFALTVSAVGQTYTIYTVAGNGTTGSSGDGGAATSAKLNGVAGIAVDSSGNLYIADIGNYRVRMVTPDGTIWTVAGNGSASDSGDGGPATSAGLAAPVGVAVDSRGFLYISDETGCIRRVAPDGTITTVVGVCGTSGSSGDGGAPNSALLDFPVGVAVDSKDDLYIAEANGGRVRKVTFSGRATITTVAGTGSQGYSGDGSAAISATLRLPNGVAVDSTGNLYIADTFNHCIRKVTPGGTISTVAGTGSAGYSGDGGAAESAKLQEPALVAVDSSGNLYIADTGNNRIRKVTSGGTISTVAGTGSAGYSGDGGAATSATLNSPAGIAVDAAGRIWIGDSTNARVRVLISGSTLSSCAYSVGTNDLGVAAAGGQVKIAIHAGLGCPWSLGSLPSWLTVSGNSSGALSGEATLLASSNSGAARVGTFSVAGVSVPIRQTNASACGGSTSCVMRVLPHLAFGNEWTTGLFALNSDSQTQPFTVAFYGNDGSSLTNPATLTVSVPARGTNYGEIGDATWPTTGGWGLVAADASVTLHGLFRRAPAGGGYYEAGVAESGGYSRFQIPFDATTFTAGNAPFYTGIAIANLNPSASAHVGCTAYDQSGTVITNAVAVPALSPLGHWADYLFTALAGKRGTIDCSADTLRGPR